MLNVDEFVLAYIEAALWSSSDDRNDKDEYLDANFSESDLANETKAKMRADCEAFCRDNEILLAQWPGGPYSAEEIGGHDFWLTRNGHGSGFWDGDWPEEVGEKLTEKAKACGEVWLYVGDDGKIYCEGGRGN